MSTQISRRAFVQDASLAALGVTALAAIAGPAAADPAAPAPDAPDAAEAPEGEGAPAGGMPPMMGNGPVEDPAWREAPAEPTESEVVETYDCEVLVIGLGHAGCCALRAAAEAGASVCAMEDQAEDSMSFLAGGQVGHINSQFLAERGVPKVDTIEFLNDWQVRSNNRSNPALIRNYATHAGACFDWLIDCLSDDDKASMTIRQWPASDTYQADHSGVKTWVGTANTGSFQSTILQNCIDVAASLGAKVYYGTKGYLLTQDETGAVTGAYGQRDAGFIKVNASKGVILCTGDFSTNASMCADLLHEIVDLLPAGGSISAMGAGRDGSGIKMGYWAGGRLDPCMSTMDGAYWYPTDSPMDPIGTTAALWLNCDGKRYSNEGFGSTELTAMPGAYQPEGFICTVFDSNIEEQMKAQPLGHMSYDYANMDFSSLQETLDAAYAGGAGGSNGTGNGAGEGAAGGGDKAMMGGVNVFAADDYETLGSYLGYEGEALENFVASIERYNELCEKGADEDFGKDPSLLFPVKEPPFYAYGGTKEIGVIMVTTSGLVIDEFGRVLGNDFRPIPGLLAAGNASGCRYGWQYFTSIAGQSLSTAQTLGMLAGQFAATGAINGGEVVHVGE